MPTFNQLLVILSFVLPFWAAFWWIERRGSSARDREKLLTSAQHSLSPSFSPPSH